MWLQKLGYDSRRATGAGQETVATRTYSLLLPFISITDDKSIWRDVDGNARVRKCLLLRAFSEFQGISRHAGALNQLSTSHATIHLQAHSQTAASATKSTEINNALSEARCKGIDTCRSLS